MTQPSSCGSPRPRGYIHQPICSFIPLSKNRVLTKTRLIHGRFIFISPLGSTQRDPWNSTARFRTLIISSKNKLLTAPLAHDEQHVGTLIGGCLEILFLPYTWLSNIRFLSVNLLRILLLLKYSLCSFYIILEISSFSAHSQPGKSQSMPVFLIIKTIYRLYIHVHFQ